MEGLEGIKSLSLTNNVNLKDSTPIPLYSEGFIMATPCVTIKSASFSDGSRIEFSEKDIVVFVGPNNSGKSAALKNIFEKAKNFANEGIVIKEIALSKEGSKEDLLAWLEHVSKKQMQNPTNPGYSRLGITVHKNQSEHSWTTTPNTLNELASFFVYHLSTESRLSAANPASNIALTRDPLTHPIHYLQVYDEIELQISNYFKQAFGQELIVHRNAGNQVPLHCGERPIPKEGEDRVSLGYIKELEKLPTLHTQGDGMRSFVGVLLHSLVVDHSAVLIDEPEAFLHPPQARLLGKMLIENAPPNRQMFIATHSGDFIRGLLDASTERVRIVRIQREENINKIRELDYEGIKIIWGDQLLRHSNVLDGLFHEKVVICESDSDCRFYAAVLDALFENRKDIPKPDFMFTHCGGKDRLPVVIQALYKLGVPVIVISDFDVLNNESPLKEIYENLGGDWDEVRSEWSLVKASIEQKKPELSSEDVIKEINNVLSKINEKVFPDSCRKDITKILKQSSPWSIAKSVGKSYIPSGAPTQACNHLFDKFKELGFFVVEVGELEGFVRSVGNHGPKWVNIVLAKDLLNDPELDAARQFVNNLARKP